LAGDHRSVDRSRDGWTDGEGGRLTEVQLGDHDAHHDNWRLGYNSNLLLSGLTFRVLLKFSTFFAATTSFTARRRSINQQHKAN
jgi:hypothetical protein